MRRPAPHREQRGTSFYIKAVAGVLTFAATITGTYLAYLAIKGQPQTTANWVRQANAACDQDIGPLHMSIYDGLVPSAVDQGNSPAQPSLVSKVSALIAFEGSLSKLATWAPCKPGRIIARLRSKLFSAAETCLSTAEQLLNYHADDCGATVRVRHVPATHRAEQRTEALPDRQRRLERGDRSARPHPVPRLGAHSDHHADRIADPAANLAHFPTAEPDSCARRRRAAADQLAGPERPDWLHRSARLGGRVHRRDLDELDLAVIDPLPS